MNLITGSTGFVGSAIVLELLSQTNQAIYCLVRSKKKQSAKDRVIPLLKDLVGKYDYAPSLIDKIDKYCHVIEGDLRDPQLIDKVTKQVGKVKQFWHVAASLNYEERFRDEIFEINLEGTRKVLKLAQKLGVQHFNHFSTAYVAGKMSGLIKEEPIDEVESNNVYEASKIQAENEVLNTTAFNTRIFRPSVVVGHSKTFYAFNFTGLYGFQRRLGQFAKTMKRIQRNYFDQHLIKIKADPDAYPNFVPVDFVAKNAVKAVLQNSLHKIYHLTNPTLISTKEIIGEIFKGVGIPVPDFVSDGAKLTEVDQKFNEKIDFYISYLTGQKMFDRTHINHAIQETDTQKYALSRETLKKQIRWYFTQDMDMYSV